MTLFMNTDESLKWVVSLVMNNIGRIAVWELLTYVCLLQYKVTADESPVLGLGVLFPG